MLDTNRRSKFISYFYRVRGFFFFVLDKKKVQWMLDANGEPWTWIMGEHRDDKTIEQIIEEEAREAARVQAEYETEQLRYFLYIYI